MTMFQTIVAEKLKTHILCSMIPFPGKSCSLLDNVAKYHKMTQATYDNMAHAHCMLGT